MKSQRPSIAIIYLAIGKYDIFWEKFYTSCEQYFLPDGEKYYFVFTDSVRLLAQNYSDVSFFVREDQGWGLNASSKYSCILQIREQLEKFAYIFYINANYQILTPIYCREILPDKSNHYLVALSFDYFRPLENNSYPYDRNPDSRACIPFGQGSYYYQSSFFGGRRQELMKLAEVCYKDTQIDLNNGIMALWHDESYMNKYLLNLTPRIINTSYCKPEEFEGESKAILRNKNKILGVSAMNQLKAAFVSPTLSYLRDEKMNSKPLHLIKTSGRLGNQLFQYAYLLGLRYHHPEYTFCLYNLGEADYYIDTLFDLPNEDFASSELIAHVQNTPQQYIHVISEQANTFQKPDLNWLLVTIHIGYWQTELYFKDIEQKIKTVFRFDETKLNVTSKKLAIQIKSGISVSIHIRRGDYLELENIYGHICTNDYYTQAIEKIRNLLPDEEIRFFLFSDEPAKIEVNLFPKNSVVIKCNLGNDSWQDLYLMSLCNHNIIANSSFSWWGAWLNEHKNKIVIAPYRWYNTMLAPDIHPKSWIRIFPSDYIPNKLVDDLMNNRLSLENKGLLNGKMGLIIFLFNFSRIYKDIFCENIANSLLDSLMEELDINTTLDYANGLSGIGTGLEYLLQHQFIAGIRDEIFEDLDLIVDNAMSSLPEDTSLEYGIGGWIRYFKFRTTYSEEDNQRSYPVNKNNLSRLEAHIEMKKANGTHPFGDFHSWDNSIGLRGRAGQELYRIAPEVVRTLM